MYTILDLCVCCLTNNNNLISILSRDKDGVPINAKILVFLLELVNFGPETSVYICVQCLENLNNYYNFKKLCLRNIFIFNSYVCALKSANEPKANLEVTLFDIKHLNVNQINSENESNSQCLEIESTNLDVDIESTGDEDEDSEDEHNQRTDIDEGILRKEDNTVQNNYTGVDNNDNNAEAANLSKQLEAATSFHENEFIDTIVREPEEISDEVDIKSQLDHLESEKIINTELPSNSSPKPTQDRIFKCKQCPETFSSRKRLLRHSFTHSGVKPYQCDLCDKTYLARDLIERHKLIHSGEKPFKCDLCDKAYRDKFQLMRHRRSHTGEKPYRCDVCDKRFAQTGYLLSHKKIHSGIRPHKCDNCGKEFITFWGLVKHKRVHTGEKPYKCEVCDKRFSNNFARKTHQYVHVGEKPFACDTCGKGLTTRRSLGRHILKHQNNGQSKM